MFVLQVYIRRDWKENKKGGHTDTLRSAVRARAQC